MVKRKAWEESLYKFRSSWQKEPVEKVKDSKVSRYDDDDIINHLAYPVNRLPPSHAKKCDARYKIFSLPFSLNTILAGLVTYTMVYLNIRDDILKLFSFSSFLKIVFHLPLKFSVKDKNKFVSFWGLYGIFSTK